MFLRYSLRDDQQLPNSRSGSPASSASLYGSDPPETDPMRDPSLLENVPGMTRHDRGMTTGVQNRVPCLQHCLSMERLDSIHRNDRISQSPAAVRSVDASVVGAIRTSIETPTGKRSTPACVQRPRLRPDRHSGDCQPTAGGPSAASPGRRSLPSRPLSHPTCSPTRPDDHERCHERPCSRSPAPMPGTGFDFTLDR